MVTEFTLNVHIEDVLNQISQAAKDRMFRAVNLVRNTTLETLSGQRTGKVYKVPGTKGAYYTASAPGEAPASATGHLRQRIKTEVVEEDGEVVGYVGTDVDHGQHLEFGTRNMAPRPWLEPSFQKSEDDVQKIFNEKWAE